MGTVFEIAAYSESPAQASDAINHALREIVRLDDVMSDYKADSDLSRLNRTGYSHPQSVPRDLYRVIEESLEYSRLSGGKFDVTVGPLVRLWKAALRGEHAPSAEEEEKLRPCVGYQKIELLPPNRIQLHSPCLQIDLGSIGKGYALDRAAEILHARGVSRALLDAGGSSIYALGAPPGESGWRVHLRDPSNSENPEVRLSGNSVSTSEQTQPSLLLGQEPPGHIVDPDSGLPLRTPFAVSVVARTATASDALSTTLLLLGPEKGEEVVRRLADVAAIWIGPEGRAKIASSGPQIILSGKLQGVVQSEKAESRELH
jgi:thiamine biosynthesis lipoprotein